jgi:HPt (histidine-containing phosphotransfer) domain-containing protein
MGTADEPATLMDASQHRMMKDALGEDFAALTAEFFADCTRFSDRLTALAGAGDANGFRELSHELKGPSSLLGFAGIAACAGEWEMMAKDGKLPDPASIHARLPALVEGTRKQLAEMP